MWSLSALGRLISGIGKTNRWLAVIICSFKSICFHRILAQLYKGILALRLTPWRFDLCFAGNFLQKRLYNHHIPSARVLWLTEILLISLTRPRRLFHLSISRTTRFISGLCIELLNLDSIKLYVMHGILKEPIWIQCNNGEGWT